MRRGKKPAYCAPAARGEELSRLRARQQALGEQLARRADAGVAAAHGHRGPHESG